MRLHYQEEGRGGNPAKTSALVHDDRFRPAGRCRVAAPGEAAGAGFSSGSEFGNCWPCADSVSPG